MSDENDQSTNGVIDWISFYQKEFVRINPSDIIRDLRIDEELNCFFKIGEIELDLSKVTSFWYRRGHLNLLTTQMVDNNFLFTAAINGHLKSENIVLGEYILKYLAKKENGIGNYHNTDVNKFDILKRAKKVGLKTPETIVVSQKKMLEPFIRKHGTIITKAIGEVIRSVSDNVSITSYTKRLGKAEFDSLPSTFSYSLFQNEIIKRYELRIFFIENLFYPMAIFSQLDSQTEVDFRVYNTTKPNRNVPYILPREIETQLSKLMLECNYNTGSIDMIVTKEQEYIFLEVNPVGQFDMVSWPCNYYLQQKIALKLCQ
jgi:ATP-GRASP peptide maturase of grasp-with-spasm system